PPENWKEVFHKEIAKYYNLNIDNLTHQIVGGGEFIVNNNELCIPSDSDTYGRLPKNVTEKFAAILNRTLGSRYGLGSNSIKIDINLHTPVNSFWKYWSETADETKPLPTEDEERTEESRVPAKLEIKLTGIEIEPAKLREGRHKFIAELYDGVVTGYTAPESNDMRVAKRFQLNTQFNTHKIVCGAQFHITRNDELYLDFSSQKYGRPPRIVIEQYGKLLCAELQTRYPDLLIKETKIILFDRLSPVWKYWSETAEEFAQAEQEIC
ncbi:MAG: hypothetical protein Q7K43_02210, partial [Candidatus Woesearchaeota archaeon]|nr:hypothetical protein [Candidatus Woesearchaeota archaeon]